MPIGTKPFKASVSRCEIKQSRAGNDYTTCTLRTAKKDKKTGEWIAEFWDCTIFDVIQDKTKIIVEEFSLEQVEFMKRDGQTVKKYAMTVYKWKPADEQEASPSGRPYPKGVKFESISDEGELPF